MVSSNVLDVAIALMFCFGAVAVISSSIYEAGASIWKLRAGFLFSGIKELLNDPNFNGLAQMLYNHALVNPQHSGTDNAAEANKAGQPSKPDTSPKPNKPPKITPSYIDSKQFALAMIDIIQQKRAEMPDIPKTIDAITENEQIRALLKGTYQRAEEKVERVQEELSVWFDAAMDRVSGNYKRRAQLVTFLIGLGISALLNLDPARIAYHTWKNPAQIAQLSIGNTPSPDKAFEMLGQMPVGWESGFIENMHFWTGFWTVVGWLVTAAFALFGAPFWFDLLQRLSNLRGAGPRPETTAAKSASSSR